MKRIQSLLDIQEKEFEKVCALESLAPPQRLALSPREAAKPLCWQQEIIGEFCLCFPV